MAREQQGAQALQGGGQIGKGGAVAQRPRLALDQRHIVLPVTAGLAAIEQPLMARALAVLAQEDDALGVEADAHHLPDPFAGHRVAVARDRHQGGARHPPQGFHIAVEGGRHGHRGRLLMGEHLRYRQLAILGVAHLRPHRAAALEQPGIEWPWLG